MNWRGPRRGVRITLLRRTALVVAIGGTLFGSAMSASPAFASSGTGPFCYPAFLDYNQTCFSSYNSNFRRTIGNADSDWTNVGETGNSLPQRSNSCYTNGCTANTGYWSYDQTGYSWISSIGGPYDGDDFWGYEYV
jgi:hypothetical protein